MDSVSHGLSVGMERVDNKYYLYLKAIGKLTHEDYEIIVPLIDNALSGIKNPDIIALIDGSEFEGWELRAAWDDFRLSFRHGGDFKKVAVVGNKKWLQVGSKIGSWLISGKVRQFDDKENALEWLLN